MRPFSTFSTALVFAIGLSICGNAFAQIQWQSDLNSARQIAAEKDNLILLHFSADWCRPCQNLEQFVFTNVGVEKAIMDHVVPVKVDVDLHPDLVAEFDVQSVPYDVIVTPSGKVVVKRSSPKTSDGYLSMMRNLQRSLNGGAEAHVINNTGSRPGLDGSSVASSGAFPGGNLSDSFVPNSPEHSQPGFASAGANLVRQSSGREQMMRNPYAADDANADNNIAVSSNQFNNESSMRPQPTGRALASLEMESSSSSNSNGHFQNNHYTQGDDTPLSTANVRPNVAVTTNSNSTNSQTTNTQTTPDGSLASGGTFGSGGNFGGTGGSFGAAFKDSQMPAAPQPSGQAELGYAQIKTEEKPKSVATIQSASGQFGSQPRNAQSQPTQQQPQQVTQQSPQVQLAENRFQSSENGVRANNGSMPAVTNNETKLANHTTPDYNTSNSIAPNAAASQSLASSDSPRTRMSAPAIDPSNGNGIALHGKCPVTLVKSAQWVDGNATWGCVHRGRTYLFASEANKDEFQQNPDKYSPLLAGYDPVIYHESGILVEGLEEHGVFMGRLPNQRVILFSTTESRQRFQQQPADYIETVRQAMLGTSGTIR